MGSDRRRLAFRAMAVLYGATAAYFIAIFVGRLERHPHEIHTAVFGYALFTAAAAYGLWRQQQWGKAVAIIIALGTSALGAFAVLYAVLGRKGSLVGPILLFVVATGLTYLLSLRVFNPPPADDI